MAVDLTDRAPAPQRDGPLWEALLAALAVAGVFPAPERDGHRLVDAIALVPVPTAAVLEDGADIVVSGNLMGAETLERVADGAASRSPTSRPRSSAAGMLDTMLEVMDLSQLDTSTPARRARRRRRHPALRSRRLARLPPRRPVPGRRPRRGAGAAAALQALSRPGRSGGRPPRGGVRLGVNRVVSTA